MGTAKGIRIHPIAARAANAFMRREHYSGKVVQNSFLHLGVWLGGALGGVIQFGPSLDKSKLIGLVRDTAWHGFAEINRMAFTALLPRNSESRALAVACRILRRQYPQIEWLVSYADATRCGDGTIYRAAGFSLTAIKRNNQIWRLPAAADLDPAPLLAAGLGTADIETLAMWLASLQGAPHAHVMSLQGAPHAHVMSLEGGVRPNALLSKVKKVMRRVTNGGTSAKTLFKLMGGQIAEGHQLRYIKFLNAAAADRLTTPILPYSEIERAGAQMYLGQPRAKQAMAGTTGTAAVQR
jgi:hypothetical protein